MSLRMNAVDVMRLIVFELIWLPYLNLQMTIYKPSICNGSRWPKLVCGFKVSVVLRGGRGVGRFPWLRPALRGDGMARAEGSLAASLTTNTAAASCWLSLDPLSCCRVPLPCSGSPVRTSSAHLSSLLLLLRQYYSHCPFRSFTSAPRDLGPLITDPLPLPITTTVNVLPTPPSDKRHSSLRPLYPYPPS